MRARLPALLVATAAACHPGGSGIPNPSCPPGADLPECRIAFEDVSASAGIDHFGASWGLAWADIDGDGDPDLYIGNHGSPPALYRNDDGVFTEVTEAWMPGRRSGDAHGAAFADFDNDGDPDLIELTGRGQESPHSLWVNEGGFFHDRAEVTGVAQFGARGRDPMWLDANADGWLDLFINNHDRPDGLVPRTLMMSRAGQLYEAAPSVGFEMPDPGGPSQLADLDADGLPELLLHSWYWPQRILEIDRGRLARRATLEDEVRVTFPTAALIADYDNDGRDDLLFLRGRSGSDVALIGDRRIQAVLQPKAQAQGFRFRSTGLVRMTSDTGLPWTDIHLGAGGDHAPGATHPDLDPTDPQFHGAPSFEPGVDAGFYIGYDVATSTWTLSFSHPVELWVRVILEGEAPITDLEAIDVPPPLEQQAVFLFYREGRPDGYVDELERSGIVADEDCGSGTTGDFDNDMDIDVYVVCRKSANNIPNKLYQNQGDGTFIDVTEAAGVAGSLLGLGDRAVTVDYDGDGFLDLYLTNGRIPAPVGLGPDQLFRNVGNGNHWLQIDLEGTASNRDAIGAVVSVDAGGVTQRRVQTNGIRDEVQDHRLLHFGLREHEVVDRITVRWPSGVVQELFDVDAGQVLRIVEAE